MMRNEPVQAEDSVEIEIRAVREQDRTGWCKLFASYGHFYDQQLSENVLDRVWGWLARIAHQIQDCIAAR